MAFFSTFLTFFPPVFFLYFYCTVIIGFPEVPKIYGQVSCTFSPIVSNVNSFHNYRTLLKPGKRSGSDDQCLYPFPFGQYIFHRPWFSRNSSNIFLLRVERKIISLYHFANVYANKKWLLIKLPYFLDHKTYLGFRGGK